MNIDNAPATDIPDCHGETWHDGSCKHRNAAQPETEAYRLGFERGYINAPRSEGSEFGGGWYTDEWRRGWDAGYEQWDGKRGFRDVF
jgi:hypothetical protein